MSFGLKIDISGDYALFSRPEMKVERVSYDVITPSAARGIFEAIYWKPQMKWRITEIRAINPIRFTNIRRNEIGSKIPVQGPTGVNAAMGSLTGNLGLSVEGNRQQRAAMLLTDVRYIISAEVIVLGRRFEKDGEEHPENEVAAKHLEMFKRRAKKGQYFHQPYFGCREFPVRFDLVSNESDIPPCHESLNGEKDLGFMLHDIDFEMEPGTRKVQSTTPRFFRATMNNGVIKVPPFEQSIA